MSELTDKIYAVLDAILQTDVPQRDGLPAHVWAMQLRDELEDTRRALVAIRDEIQAERDNDLFLPSLDTATCTGCHAIVSIDLTERGLCQRCRS